MMMMMMNVGVRHWKENNMDGTDSINVKLYAAMYEMIIMYMIEWWFQTPAAIIYPIITHHLYSTEHQHQHQHLIAT